LPSVGSSARRYAEAIFELAQESGNLDAWHADLSLLASVFSDVSALRFFKNPRKSISEKQDMAKRLFEGKVQPQAMYLLQMLIDRDRVEIVPAILSRFEELLREARGIVVAEVTTAVPVDDNEKQQIVEQLSQITGKQIELHTKVDPSIIGGIVVRVGDKLVDGSVATALTQLHRSLTLR